MAEERLQKIMAAAGIASRRTCESLIEAGRVQVDGQVVTELGTKVDPDKVEIRVDGQPIHQPKRHVYYKVYKPRGVLSDIGGDTWGRQTVADLLPEDARRVFPVGRLDLISEGMVLLTDDGELANRLTHPRYEHPKIYYVLVQKLPTMLVLENLRTGIDLPTGRTQPCKVTVAKSLPEGLILDEGNAKGVWLQFVLREGKKRQIRHMTAAVGYPTQRLVRWAIGPVTVEGVKPGEYRPLTGAEVAALKGMITGEGSESPPRPAAAKPRIQSNRGGPSSRRGASTDKDEERGRSKGKDFAKGKARDKFKAKDETGGKGIGGGKREIKDEGRSGPRGKDGRKRVGGQKSGSSHKDGTGGRGGLSGRG